KTIEDLKRDHKIEIDKLDQTIKDKDDEISNLKKECDRQKIMYDAQKKIVKKLEKDKKELNELYKQSKRNNIDYESVKNQLDNVKNEKDKLEKEIEDLKNKIDKKDEKINEISNNIKEIFNIVKDLLPTLLREIVKEIEKNNHETVDINNQIK
ncbi:7294_t:CDS:1, partial [Scutellospora calospora]